MAGLAGEGAAQVIDTETPWRNLGRIGATTPFGEAGPGVYEAFGQTFVAPAGFPTLATFRWSLYRAEIFGPDATTFAAYVAEWDPVNRHIVGDFLFESGPRVLAGADMAWEAFTFHTGGLLLDPAKPYIMFLSARPFYNGLLGAAGVAGLGYDLGGDVYLEGNAYLGIDFARLDTDASWIRPANDSNRIGGTDFAIYATFTEFRPIPEPATYGIAAMGLLLGVLLSRLPRSRMRTA